ncbi:MULTISPECIES: superoxide dismutase, Ni [unclassified Cobetia]|jgi:nickel superoxide dismutase|uniref:superoxide dismutase, Ni n=1 Tax=unclassified Cobetia TaxID=2609414 RepID=UPI000C55D90F|nr:MULTISPECIES: superoxide dismutase, Ni [unclassified Cobetia]MBF10387.1 superoxide dismutase, Ni [Cobetia sp.]BBO56280.1 superoxide dismutase [Ni] [Cobetia sp. AM6]HAR09658.1 superoxide dismutase, Ni [Cobetia sp.]HBJ27017.1 superoxide dismutase, Ni [Cobetia sp.]|tara:strand:- start:55161 stop:55661 length:501 start_codon:yes stop_codon:yes gene_type:complete
MIHALLRGIDRLVSVPAASAHCDIPCKIYDPSAAQIAALSVIRFMDLINELGQKDSLTLADQALLARLVEQKESHAEKAKHEIRIIWGDYIKQPQRDAYPNIDALVHSIMLAGSVCKQGIERDKGEKLLTLINEFAAAFWDTKGVTTFTATCPYPPSEDVAYPKLD